MKKTFEKIEMKVMRSIAIVEGSIGYGIASGIQAMTYGLTTNETARDLADICVAGSRVFLMGANTIGMTEEEFWKELEN